MKLKRLTIELQPSYAKNPGKYEAEIQYENERGEVKLLLDPEISNALLTCIGGVVTEFSHKAALSLEADIQQSVLEATKGAPAIEAQ